MMTRLLPLLLLAGNTLDQMTKEGRKLRAQALAAEAEQMAAAAGARIGSEGQPESVSYESAETVSFSRELQTA